MKKALYIMMMVLAVAGSAFAQTTANPTNGPVTIDNYDNCDISVSPAASLLLPYFAVDLANTAGRDTLFTITNVSDVPAVAHVTVWSNWSFPVLDFNIFLTGYDVEGVSMRDVIVSGNLPSTGIPSTISPRGSRSLGNTVNPHKGATFGTDCNGNQGGPGAIPSFLRTAIRNGLTGGAYLDCDQVGDDVAGDGSLAVGYVTIDVANTCSQSLPIDPTYFNGEILYDNQLIGDYIRIDSSNNYAGGNPLVHIKAVPPGGLAGGTAPTINFPRTFYSRYQTIVAGTSYNVLDRRQPLPAVFAARYIDGASAAFATDMVIWREGITTDLDTDCDNIALNSTIPFVETVKFDTKENPSVRGTSTCPVSPCPPASRVTLTETQAVDINDTTIFPADPSATDPSGWLYLNMANPDQPYGAGTATQNWVIVAMSAGGRFAVDFDAAWLSNGCTGFIGITEGGASGITGNKIGPKYSNLDPTLNWP